MARIKRLDSSFILQFLWLSAFCVSFQGLICASQHVPSSEEAGFNHQNITSTGQVYLNTSSDVTIKVGQQLKLNCTIVGAINSSNVQLSWHHGDQELTNVSRKINNETIQLVIDRVSWSNRGSYTCRESNDKRVQSKTVMVTVGDIPGPPQNVWINNVEMRTYIHWTAPVHQGGLQLSYAIKGKCKNASIKLPECQKDSFKLCEVVFQEHGSAPNQFACQVMAILHQTIPLTSTLVTYVAFVEASNVLGSTKSDGTDFNSNNFNPLLTTPQPNISPSVKEVEPPGTVKLTWRDAKPHRGTEVEYTVLYHKDGDSQNKSVIVHAPRTYVLISDLVGFSSYHFYILVRYANQDTTIYGIYSKATELTLQTKMSAPKVPPVITNCSHWTPALMVTWKIPRADYFNGPTKSATIFYRCQIGQNISGNFTVSNLTARSAVITSVTPSDACQVWIVWMELCNKPGLCTGISNMCRAEGSVPENSSPGPGHSRKSDKEAVLISAAGAVGGVVLVLIIFTCYRRRKNNAGNARRPLRNVLVLPQVVHGYDEIEEPLENNNCYDLINV